MSYPVVILCGGRGMRIRDGAGRVPKPMVEVGGMPLLQHIMVSYKAAGFHRFILCVGYLSEVIRRSFVDSDWDVTFSDAGDDAETGERLLRARPMLDSNTFLATYGDNVSDVPITKLVSYHETKRLAATVTCVRTATTFGVVDIQGDGTVSSYREKPVLDLQVNGGFYCFNQGVFDYIRPGEIFERAPIQRLVAARQLAAYRHDGFWACMDTPKDNLELNAMWDRGDAPWAP